MEMLKTKLAEMQVEAQTCNDLQVTCLANTQDDPQIKEESELYNEDNFDETEIVSQFWLEKQAGQIRFPEFLRYILTNVET